MAEVKQSQGKNDENDDGSTNERAVESSKDSSESSDSHSESGDESGSSSGSSSSNQNEQESDGADQSAANDHESVESGNSNESFKTVNASMVKSGVDEDEGSVDLAMSSKTVAKEAAKPASFKSPTHVEAVAEGPMTAVVPTDKKKKTSSPVVITPAKSLVFSPPQVDEIDFDQIPDGAKSKTSGKFKLPSSPAVTLPKPELSPGELSERDVIKPKATIESRGTEHGTSRKRGRGVNKAPKKETRCPKLKRSKKDKVDKGKSKQMKSVENVEKQVKLLQAQLEEVRGSGARRRKKHSSSKKRKSFKSKKSKNQSSGDDSSGSSSSEEPTSSARIGKIPMSRKLQGLAMERAKQLGTTRQGEVDAVEIADALKVIDNTVFPVEPTQAYFNFHKLPGSGLEHIVKHLTDLMEDIGLFVGTSAKLNLQLAHEQNQAKKQRVGPEAGNEFVRIWQFCNDLARTTSPPDQRCGTPARTRSEGSESAKGNSKGAAGGSRPRMDQVNNAEAEASKSPAVGNPRQIKKTKSAGTKSEELA